MDPFSNKDFSDDSLMVNESIDPSASTGPALTNAGLEESPYLAQKNHDEGEPAPQPPVGDLLLSTAITTTEATATSTPTTTTATTAPAITSAPVSDQLISSTISMTTTPSISDRQIEEATTTAQPITNVLLASQDGDDGSVGSLVSNGRHIGQSVAFPDAEAYADSLTREILNDTNQLVRSRSDNENVENAVLNDDIENVNNNNNDDNDTSRRSSNNSDVANKEESHWEYKSVLKETPIDSESTGEVSSQAELQRAETDSIIPVDSDSSPEPEVEPQQEHEIHSGTKPEQEMEFAKNYSDDLLMGQNDPQAQGESHATNADLADFELPPYSGSSSGSSGEPTAKQQSPTHKAQSSPSTSSQSASLSPPSLTALRDLLKSNYSRVSHIFHWRKPIESGICFAIGITLIIALTFFSIISVFAYSTLGLMLAAGTIRLYKTVMKTLNRSTDTPFDHIWNQVQTFNPTMSHEKMHELVDSSLGNFNASLKYFKQVLLVEDKVSTLKFGAFVYFLTYIGAWFNGMTLITIGHLGLFSVPILYEKNKTKIDELLNLATSHLCSVTNLVTNKIGSLVSGSSAAATTVKKQD